MASLFQCDRCKRLENHNDRNTFLHKHTSTLRIQKFTLNGYNNEDEYDGELRFELCEDCSNKLRTFIEQPNDLSRIIRLLQYVRGLPEFLDVDKLISDEIYKHCNDIINS